MISSPETTRRELLGKVLRLLWLQWTELGLSGHGSHSNPWVLDPEALLLATCHFGRYDPRLFDEVVDWLGTNGGIINLQRLKNINQRLEFFQEHTLSALGSHLCGKTNLEKWKSVILTTKTRNQEPYFRDGRTFQPFIQVSEPDPAFAKNGWLRPPLSFSRKSRAVHGNGTTRLLIRLRALFGVNARAEILGYLLTHESVHPSGLAASLSYDQRSVQDNLVSMYASDLLVLCKKGREKHYGLNREAWLQLFGAKAEIPVWIRWPWAYRGLITLFDGLEGIPDGEDSLYLSARIRSFAEKVREDLQSSKLGWNLPSPTLYPGESYVEVFLEGVRKILD